MKLNLNDFWKWADKVFLEYEHSRPEGAEIAVRRYLGVLAVLVPMHMYLTYWFSHSSMPTDLSAWATGVGTTHSLMILPSIVMLAGCVFAIKHSQYEQTLLMIVNAAYLGLGAVLSYTDITLGGASNLGGSTFLICSLAVSVMYLAPPYITAPFYVAAMGGAAVTFYLLDNNVYTTHPGLLVNVLIALPMTITMSVFVWQHFNARVILSRRLETTRALLARKQEELDKLVEVDALTGLYNKRRFREITNRDYAKSTRQPHGSSGSLLLIDIDRLQNVNLKYGHQIGDKVISRVAKAIKRQLRTTDVAGRVGGDLFSVFLSDTTKEGAEQVAEKVRADIEGYKLTFPQTSEREQLDIRVTVSVGISSWFAAPNSANMGTDDINLLADHALRNAKNAGRNRIMAS